VKAQVKPDCRLLKRPLELSTDEIRRLVELTTNAIVKHYGESAKAPFVGDPPRSSGPLFENETTAPTVPASFDELLLFIFNNIMSNSLDLGKAGNLSFIPNGGIFHSAIADFIVSAVNRHTGLSSSSPGLVELEHTVVKWFARMMNLPQSAGGILTSGGSLANFSAIFTARRTMLGDSFQNGTLYLSDHTHFSVAKGAILAGLPERNIRQIAVDARFKIKIPELLNKIHEDRRAGLVPFLLVGNAGTTNTGSVDPLYELASLAQNERLWFHVDAAYGGFFALTERGRKVLHGIEQADSITLDPHKSLFLPYGTGCLLVRDQESLLRAHKRDAEYLPTVRTRIVDPCDLSPELSRNHRGLRVWLPLKMHGIDVFRAALDEKIDLAQYIADELRSFQDVDVMAAPELSTLAFRLKGPDSQSVELLKLLNERGNVHLSATRLLGKFAIRICVLSFKTHREHADRLLEDLHWGISQMRRAIPLQDHFSNRRKGSDMAHTVTDHDELNRYRNVVLSRIGIKGCTAHFLSEATHELDFVAQLIARAFVEREPMTNVIYQKSSEQSYEEMVEAVRRLVHDPAVQDCSVMLKDGEGRVISAMIHTPYDHNAFDLPETFAAINSVLNRLSESFDNWLKKREEKPKVLYGLLTAVDPDYTGYALVKHQLDLALFRARQLGYSELAGSVTSVSQVIFERLGLHVVAEINYDDYELFRNVHASTSMTRHPVKSAKMMWCKINEIRTDGAVTRVTVNA
jgi:aromatic-L-amino-acid decarboxylase